MFNALTSYMNLGSLDEGTGAKHGTSGGAQFDAVVHFAAIPRILLKPDNETYRVNTMGTYNVLEASLKLGIRKVVPWHALVESPPPHHHAATRPPPRVHHPNPLTTPSPYRPTALPPYRPTVLAHRPTTALPP